KLRAVITVKTKVNDKEDTKSYEYRFGNDKSESLIYAKQGWRDMIFTVDKNKDSGLVHDLLTKDFLDAAVLALDLSKVKSIKLVGWYGLTEMPITVELENKSGQWSVKTPAMQMPKTPEITRFVAGLANLRAERFAAHNVKEPEASY